MPLEQAIRAAVAKARADWAGSEETPAKRPAFVLSTLLDELDAALASTGTATDPPKN